MTRALERGQHAVARARRSRCVGFGFLAKMLQAFLVLPAFGLVYLVAAPPRRATRIWQLARRVAVRCCVARGWWVAIVELWPASSRPYIGGSQNNSVLDLIFGYNGFGRLTGNETGSVGGGGGHGRPLGRHRLDADVQRRVRRPDLVAAPRRADPARRRARADAAARRAPTARAPRCSCGAAGWSSPALAFSLGKGIIHPYYTVALGAGDRRARRHRARACSGSDATTWRARAVLAVVVGVTAMLGVTCCSIARPTGTRGCAALVLVGGARRRRRCCSSPTSCTAGRASCVGSRASSSVLAAPAAYTLTTVTTPHTRRHPDRRARPAPARLGPRRCPAAAPGGRPRRRGGRRSAPPAGGQLPGGAGGRPAAPAAAAAGPVGCSTAARRARS